MKATPKVEWADAMFLLGAGASVDGKLPTSKALTQQVVASLKDRGIFPMPEDAHRSMVGALEAILKVVGEDEDYEVLAAAAKELANRKESIIDRFVEEWKPEVRDIEWGDFFSVHLMLGVAIRKCLLITEEQVPNFDYLQPLVKLGAQANGVTIATLNFDLSIESQARRLGIAVDTGFPEFNQGQNKHWDTSGIRLLKPHGSLGWTQPSSLIGPGQVLDTEFVETDDTSSDDGTPLILYDVGKKTPSSRLFRGIFSAFVQELARHDKLVVVGYSFRDPHINTQIRDWLRDKPDSKIYIIGSSGLPDFQSSAMTWPQDDKESYHGMMSTFAPLFNSSGHPAYLLPVGRISGNREGAKDGLAALLR